MEKSDDLLDQILTHGPSESTLTLILTRMKQEGRSSEVIQECLKALGRYPGNIHLRILLAESYLEAGFMGQAEAELEKATPMIDDLVSAYKLLAKLYVRQKRPEKAAEALKRYLAHKPQDQEALDLWEQVRAVQEEEVEKLPGPPEDQDFFEELATPTLAEIYYDQGQINEAISTYEKVLLEDPDDKASMQRLSELKALINEEGGPMLAEKVKVRQKKEKMITILERWQARTQDSNHGR